MTSDAVVVLGAPVQETGKPGPAMRRRVAHGVEVLRSADVAMIVLSGGVVARPPSEAEVMAELARTHGVAEERIVIEDRSRNTFENALYTGRIMKDRGWRRVIVVTDPFHMPRALFVFRRLGLEATGSSVRRRGGWSRLTWYGAYAREAVAFVRSAWLFLQGRHRPRIDAVWNA